MSAHHCHAKGCARRVPPEMLMCKPHWGMVPAPMQMSVWAHYRVGQCVDKKPSREWLAAADTAIAHVANQEREARARHPQLDLEL